jgi:aromatic-amino-acid transaminase
MLDTLAQKNPDVLLELISLHAADERTSKIDVGVGVYRNDEGVTPVFKAVKAVENLLITQQESKSYLGADGDTEFVSLLHPIIFGNETSPTEFVGLQTPGGTGALRLGAELIARANPAATIWF